MGIMLVTALLAMLIYMPLSDADLSCTMRAGSCNAGEVSMLRMYDTDNSHIEAPSQSNYNNVVCCDGVLRLDNDCSEPSAEIFLKISSATNAHAQRYLGGSPVTYPVDLCMSIQGATAGGVYCTIGDGSCPSAAPVCLASISADDNAHVGDCSAYTNRLVCCRAGRAPVVDSITYDSLRADVTFTASATDPDGDPVLAVEFEVYYGSTGFRDLGQDNSAPWTVVWDTITDIGYNNESTVQVRARAYDGVYWGNWLAVDLPYVDNTRPSASITDPSDGTIAGRIFDIIWSSNVHSDEFDIRYVDAARFEGSGWTTISGVSGNSYEMDFSSPTPDPNAQYCFAIIGIDTDDPINGFWSCDPSDQTELVSDCLCIRLDLHEPSSSVIHPVKYTNYDSFWVNWSGDDNDPPYEDAGVRCYQLQYRIFNSNSGAEILAWTDWDDINDDSKTVWDGSGCVVEQCTTLTGDTFDQSDVVSPPNDNDDSQTYEFRVRALDNAYGCGNTPSSFTLSGDDTWIDWTLPQSTTAYAWESATGLHITDGMTIYSTTNVIMNVSSDPESTDYTGVNQTWITYSLLKLGGGYMIGTPQRLSCPVDEKTCEFDPLRWEDDYNVTYMGYAVDRAGNRNVSLLRYFTVLMPLKITADVERLYLTLGGYKAVTLTISNRQTITDVIKVQLDGYNYARFVDASDGVMAPGNRSINLTLQPKETKVIHAYVYTSDVGDSYHLTVYANTTRIGFEDTIGDFADIYLKVDFPVSFPGLMWPAVIALFVFSAFLYYRHGSNR